MLKAMYFHEVEAAITRFILAVYNGDISVRAHLIDSLEVIGKGNIVIFGACLRQTSVFILLH